jgi:peptidyl-tRNA hydrolase, PTH1 family
MAMKLVIGLGNPGDRYMGTRHNLGFDVVDELGSRMKGLGVSWKKDNKLKSEIFNYTLGPNHYILVKPQTYMNNSGMAVRLVADYFKIDPADIIVIHDDLDLLLGKIKVRLGGAAAGHHGVESIINSLGTPEFTRIRLGIGNTKSHLGEHQRIHFEAEKFVMEPFLPAEKSKVRSMVKQALSEIEVLITPLSESS